MAKTLYEILGVPQNATDTEIKRAYYELAKQFHPDKAASADERVQLEQSFSQVSNAYNTLKDKDKRVAYDRSLGVNTTSVGIAAPTSDVKSGGAGTSSGRSKKVIGGDSGRTSVAKRAFLRGEKAFREGDYTKAGELFEVAVANNPGEGIYHARLAQCMLRERRAFNRAVEAAQKAIELDPYNSDYRFILAELFENANAPKRAIEVYEEILRWDSNNDRALASLASLGVGDKKSNLPFSGLLGKFFGGKK